MSFRTRVLLSLVISTALCMPLFAQELDSRFFTPYSTAEFKRTIEFRTSFSDFLMQLPGVEGTAINLEKGRPQLIVYVNESMARQIDLKRLFDEAQNRGINVDVVFVEEFEALQAQMGTSTGGIKACGAGTLGMAVRRGNLRGYVTNAHVAAVEVENLVCPNGPLQDQVSPGRHDVSCGTSTKIGTAIATTRIPDDGATAGTVDAAFVEAVPGATTALNACDVCPADLSIIDPKEAEKDKLPVVACGRGVTGNPEKRSGKVDHIKAEVWVRYNCLGARAKFTNQLMVKGMNAPKGFSGAVAFGDDKGVLGLIFAGNSKFTVVNPMQEVISELGLTLLPCQ